MKLTIKAHHFRALFKAVAGKGDPRNYLRGVLIDVKNKVLVAGDGHIMITVPYDEIEAEHSRSMIIDLPYKIPTVQCYAVEINTEEKQIDYLCKKQAIRRHYLTTIDAGYPNNYEKLFVINYTYQTYTCFNPLIIANVQKALGSPGVIMTAEPRGTGQKFNVEFVNEPDVKCVLMGMKL